MRRLGRVVIRHRPPVMDKRKLQKIERAEIMNNNFQKTSELKLTDREAKLLAIIRKMDFGEVRVCCYRRHSDKSRGNQKEH